MWEEGNNNSIFKFSKNYKLEKLLKIIYLDQFELTVHLEGIFLIKYKKKYEIIKSVKSNL